MTSDPDTSPPQPAARSHWWQLNYLRSRPRFTVATAIFVLALAVLLALHRPLASSVLLGFDIAAVVYLALIVHLFNGAHPQQMKRIARSQDAGRWGILWSSVVLSCVVMVALTLELHANKSTGAGTIVVAAASILLSWLFMNSMFAMHYAHDFYGDLGGRPSGLVFPGTKQPDYWDFAYFAVVIGMTFQVSDVQITARYMRRMALVHSVIAFFFNVFIIAVSVNIVAGLG
jgi:uncharacterized membrane protein